MLRACLWTFWLRNTACLGPQLKGRKSEHYKSALSLFFSNDATELIIVNPHRNKNVAFAAGGTSMSLKMISLFAGILLSSCAFSSDEVRYRLTLEVDTPEGRKSGSSVMAFSLQPGFPQSYSPTFRAEAVAVELGKRGTLFMTISDITAMLPENVFRRIGLLEKMPKEDRVDRVKILEFLAGQVGEKAEVQCVRKPFNAECQSFVRFRDINNPMSVEEVSAGNLSASFGNGVRMHRMMIEITDDDVTTGIEKKLPWLNALNGRYLHGGSTTMGAPLGLSVMDFQRNM